LRETEYSIFLNINLVSWSIRFGAIS